MQRMHSFLSKSPYSTFILTTKFVPKSSMATFNPLFEKTAPKHEAVATSLGEAILHKLKNSDPERVLEINCCNGSKLTVKKAHIQTMSIVQNLISIGIKQGDIVVIYSKPNDKFTPITFACLTVGEAVHFLETNLQGSVITENLQFLNPTVIIYELDYKVALFKAITKPFQSNLKYVLCIDSVILHHIQNDVEKLKLPQIGNPKLLPATLMYIPSSTGFPKLVKNSHVIIAQRLYGFEQLSSKSKIFCSSDLTYLNQVLIMILPVFFGSQRIYSSYIDADHTSQKLRQIIDIFQVSNYFDVYGRFSELLKAADQSNDLKSLASLRVVYTSGDFVTESLLAYTLKIAPNCKLVKWYGLTETSGFVAREK